MFLNNYNLFKNNSLIYKIMTETNDLIKEVAFDVISITTIWGLIISTNSSLDHYRCFAESKYFNLSFSFQDITKLVAYGSSAFLIAKYFRS
jgi:hypothetical protein